MNFVSGGVCIRPMQFAASGDVVQGHSHNFDHTTYVVRGALQIEKLDDAGAVVMTVIKRASEVQNWVLIKAGVIHRITALEDNSIGHCIYPFRDDEGNSITEFNGWDSLAYV